MEKMPWRYPAAWFLGLMAIGSRNLANSNTAAGVVIYVAATAALSYGLAYLNWRSVSRRK